jgi:hypothetical protein
VDLLREVVYGKKTHEQALEEIRSWYSPSCTRDYDEFLCRKEEAGRASMLSGKGTLNEEVEAEPDAMHIGRDRAGLLRDFLE